MVPSFSNLSATTRQRRYVSYRGEISPAPETIINRDFYATTPDQKWLTDLTNSRSRPAKYLSPVIDCFDSLVVSCSIGTRPDTELVNTMLDSASNQWLAATSCPQFTRIGVRTIAGRDGSRVCMPRD